jgi:HlyD family secretion protein
MIRDTSAQDTQRADSGRRGGRLVFVGACIAAVGIAVFMVSSVRGTGGTEEYVDRERVRTATVRRGEFVRDIAVQGRVVAAVSPTLYASDMGTVTLLVQAGDSVTVDQTVAVIESAEIQSELEQERASLSSAAIDLDRQRIQAKKQNLKNQQSIDLAQVNLTAAERESRRAETASDAITQHERDRAKDEMVSARLKLEHARRNAELEEESLEFELRTFELNVERQRLMVVELERRVDELTVVSPVNGIVGQVIVEQKDSVLRNQPLMTVVDLTEFEVEVEIPQTYADELSVGLETTISDSGRTYRGMLAAISPEVVSNQVEGRVRFVPGEAPEVKQNQRVSARILLEFKEDVLTLRRGPFLENRSGRVAFVLDGDTAKRREVITGSISVAEVEVLSGLDEGETVIISSTAGFADADSVLLTN